MQRAGQLPVLVIPAAMQKNATEEAIPLLPAFEAVLLETPLEARTGWAFNPQSLQGRLGRPVSTKRPAAEWVGKVISLIGKAADVTVDPGDPRTGRPTKYASAHDLRRSCAERLLDSGLPPTVICRACGTRPGRQPGGTTPPATCNGTRPSCGTASVRVSPKKLGTVWRGS